MVYCLIIWTNMWNNFFPELDTNQFNIGRGRNIHVGWPYYKTISNLYLCPHSQVSRVTYVTAQSLCPTVKADKISRLALTTLTAACNSVMNSTQPQRSWGSVQWKRNVQRSSAKARTGFAVTSPAAWITSAMQAQNGFQKALWRWCACWLGGW